MKIHNLSELPTIDYRTIKPLQGNLKDLDQKNHDRLLRVLNKRGFTTPVFIWKNPEDSELYLLDGHQRQRVMQKNDLNDNGNYEVPYALIPGATEQEAKEQLLEITSQYGHMTMEGLDEFAFDLDLTELDVHFDALDLDKFLDGLHDADEIEEDEAPEVDEQNPPESKLGEIYQLGRHRLMCGDSTDFGTVSELMNGVQADMVFTDPPYNTGIQQGRTAKEWGIIENDAMSSKDFDKFMADVMACVYAVTTGDKYFCIDWRGYETVKNSMPNIKSCIVWVKNNFGLGAGYRPQHEFILFDGMMKATDQSNVWEEKKDASVNYQHPTQKPVAIPGRAIKNSSKQGASVLDLFGGSGSTLIAAEKLGRTCYMMELDPKYCDVIRKRYAKHIGAEDWQAATPVIQAVEV